MANANYRVSLTITSDSRSFGGNGCALLRATNKTAGGFTVKVVPCQMDRQESGNQQLSGDQEQPGLRNDLTLDYIVVDSN
jgi:hypothetical protein